jgi:hypothetical protein
MVVPVFGLQPWETDAEYAAFLAWLGLPAGERTLKRTAEMLGRDRSSVARMSSTCRWEERTRAYQAEEDRRMLIGLQARQLVARVDQADLGRSMREMAAAGLEHLMAEDKVPTDVKDIATLATAGVKIERDALQLVNKTEAEVTVNVQASELDDNARAALRAELASRLAQLGGTEPEPDDETIDS